MILGGDCHAGLCFPSVWPWALRQSLVQPPSSCWPGHLAATWGNSSLNSDFDETELVDYKRKSKSHRSRPAKSPFRGKFWCVLKGVRLIFQVLSLLGPQEGPRDLIGELYTDWKKENLTLNGASMGEPCSFGEVMHTDPLPLDILEITTCGTNLTVYGDQRMTCCSEAAV